MDWKKMVIISAVFSYTLIGCVNYYHSSINGSFRPKKPKFLLSNSPYKFKTNDLLKPNSVYMSVDTLVYGKYKSIFYLIFFDNGRCASGSLGIDNKSIDEKISNFSNIGYFKVDENNKIELEIFYVKNKERGWYETSIGIISKDSIVFDKKNSESNLFSKFIRMQNKVQLSKISPDW